MTLEFSLMAKKGRAGDAHDIQAHAMGQNLAKIIGEMNVLRGDNTVTLCTTLGDTDWNNLWTSVIGRIGYPSEIRYRKAVGPRYLIVDAANANIDVQNAGVAVAGAAENFVRAGRDRIHKYAV